MTSLKQLLLKPLLVPGFPALLKYVQRDCATVFMLHRFSDPERGIAGCDVRHLRHALTYLARNGYEMVSLVDLFERLGGNGPQARGAVAFTIDDGYIEQATVAAPIFAEFGCPDWRWLDDIRLLKNPGLIEPIEVDGVQELVLLFSLDNGLGVGLGTAGGEDGIVRLGNIFLVTNLAGKEGRKRRRQAGYGRFSLRLYVF
jgi:hypothetical protein